MSTKMIGVDELLHKRIKILSANTGRKIYHLIEEAIVHLESKYFSRTNEENRNEQQ